MDRRRGLLHAVAVLLLAGGLAGPGTAALADGPLEVEIAAVNDADDPATVIVTVLDETGMPLAELDPASVRIEVDGEEAATGIVSRAEDASIGIAVVLAIDVSGSIAAALPAAQAGANAVVESLSERDEASVIAFAEEPTVLQPFTGDQEALAASIAGLEAMGSTTLYDAAVLSAEEALASPLPRRVIVVLSDGLDDGSTATRDEALARVTAAGVPVYAIALGADADSEFLAEIAESSGGRLVVSEGADQIEAAYRDLATLLRSQHLIEFEPPPFATGMRSAERQLTVSVATDAGTGSATRTYVSERPLPPPPSPVAIASPVVEAAVARPPAEPSGEAFPIVPAAGALALIALVGVGALAVHRARHGGTPVRPAPELGRPVRPRPRAGVARPSAQARLTMLDGEFAGQQLTVTNEVLTLASDAKRDFILPAYEGTQHPRVHVWWRDGKLMLHRVDPTRGAVARQSWATLQPGDIVEVGAHRLRVDQGPTSAAAERSP
jgi:VWFA-related protein